MHHMLGFIYTFLLALLLPLVPLKLWWRGIRQPEYRQHWRERFGFFSQSTQKPLIWLHCVSVGETRAAEPLVRALQTQYPQHSILLTHGTPTGRATGKALFGDSVQQAYLPYDLPFFVRRFLRHFKPQIGLILETELWFNLIQACKCNQTPLLLVNARLSEKSARGYARLGGLVNEGLQNLSAVLAQTQADATRLQQLGAGAVIVAGNLKFEVKPPADSSKQGESLRALLKTSKPVFLAASTREGEEALILDAIADLDILTILVPRHPQRFDEVAALIQKRGISFARKSALQANQYAGVPALVLGDSMGEMFTYYAACDFALIGGSLLDFGGQNLIEAAAMAKPILIGPHTYNFAQASEQALNYGAAIRVQDAQNLAAQINSLALNLAQREQMGAAALAFSQQFSGATARTLQVISTYLNE